MPRDIAHYEWIEIRGVTVEISVSIEPQLDTRPERNFSEERDINWVHAQLSAGNQWAWCAVRVTASIPTPGTSRHHDYRSFTHTGEDNLGCCSYQNLESFLAGGDYRDMVDMALNALSEDMVTCSKDYRHEDWATKIQLDRGILDREDERERHHAEQAREQAREQERVCRTHKKPSTASKSSSKHRRRVGAARGWDVLSWSTVARSTPGDSDG